MNDTIFFLSSNFQSLLSELSHRFEAQLRSHGLHVAQVRLDGTMAIGEKKVPDLDDAERMERLELQSA
jgi:hypothetical protein